MINISLSDQIIESTDGYSDCYSDYYLCPKCKSYDRKIELGDKYCRNCGEQTNWENITIKIEGPLQKALYYTTGYFQCPACKNKIHKKNIQCSRCQRLIEKDSKLNYLNKNL